MTIDYNKEMKMFKENIKNLISEIKQKSELEELKKKYRLDKKYSIKFFMNKLFRIC